MKYVLAELSAFYGYNCIGWAYSSQEFISVEVSDELAEKVNVLLEENEGELTKEAVEELIRNGNEDFKELHEKLVKEGQRMEIEYWLSQSLDSDTETIRESLETDLESGAFKPEYSFEQYCDDNFILTTDEDYDEDDVKCDYREILLEDEYTSWLDNLDLEEHAKKVGLDIEAVIEESASTYIISGVSDEMAE